MSINSDGTVSEVKILMSSGQNRLDQAAIEVIRLAAPFDPFPADLKQNTDVLEIIRTWKFEKGRYLSSH